MKFKGSIFLSLCLVLSFSLSLWANETTNFQSMVILGASVSNDHSAPSPGKFIAEQSGMKTSQIEVRAKGGKTSLYHKSFILNRIPEIQPDVVVAVDLFYHDFKAPKPITEEEKKRVVDYVTTLVKNSKLVILGTALGLEGVGGASVANQILYSLAEQFSNLMIVDVNTIYQQLHSANGYRYNVNGVERTLYRNQTMADYIHPNAFGCKVLANLMIDQMHQREGGIGSSIPYIEL